MERKSPNVSGITDVKIQRHTAHATHVSSGLGEGRRKSRRQRQRDRDREGEEVDDVIEEGGRAEDDGCWVLEGCGNVEVAPEEEAKKGRGGRGGQGKEGEEEVGKERKGRKR